MTAFPTAEALAQAKDKANLNLDRIIAAKGGDEFEKRHDVESMRLYVDIIFNKIKAEANQMPSSETLAIWLAQEQKKFTTAWARWTTLNTRNA